MINRIREAVKIYRIIGDFAELIRSPTFANKNNSRLLHLVPKERNHAKKIKIQGIQNIYSRKCSFLNAVVTLENSGFPFETHEVITEDGYILTLHRILRRTKEDNKIPVLLQHGLWSSSGDWIVAGPSYSLAYILANNGYDVWLGNARGNLYSRKHKYLSPIDNSKDFWNFTWHEMGSLDLPAMIDFILKTTEKKQIHYVGHSLGTTMCFVLLSTKPQYNEKIRAMFALAPVAYLSNLRNEMFRYLANMSDGLYNVLEMAGYHCFLPRNGIMSVLDNLLSRNSSAIVKNAPVILSDLCGYASDNVKNNLKELIIAHVACGTSTKLLVHLSQSLRSKKTFRQFDYGAEKNTIAYGQKEPPDYELSNIRIPVVLFYSKEDWLSTIEDVEQLADVLELSNKDKLFRKKIEMDRFNHLDFIWGTTALPNVFNDILAYMKTF